MVFCTVKIFFKYRDATLIYTGLKLCKVFFWDTQYNNKEDGQKNFQRVKVHFTIVMKLMIGGDDQNYNENNEQQHLTQFFANNCYKIVSPALLQELIKDFAVCKHCSGTLLLVEDVSHAFGNQNYVFQKETTLSNRSTQKMSHFYVMLHKVHIFKLIW